LVILNLPRSIHFKPENVIVAGLIPDPSEPNYNEINSCLSTLINHYGKKDLPLNIKETLSLIMLLGSVCDILATYKFVGYLSHQACLQCKNFLELIFWEWI